MNRATSPTGWARNPDGSLGYTWNPISGCRNHTPEGLCLGGLFPCYAWKLVHGRLKPLYLANNVIAPYADGFRGAEFKARNDPFYPRFWEDRIVKADRILKTAKKPMGIFPVDMGDWCGIGIPESWSDWILELARRYSQHRFYTLTKQPQNLFKFSPFPDNCFVGVTACNWEMAFAAFWEFQGVKASVKYISFEPLLDSVGHRELEGWLSRASIKWLIIGACTGTWQEMENLAGQLPQLMQTKFDLDYDRIKPFGKKWTLQPKIEWVREIVEAAGRAGVKVFLKDNLEPLINANCPPESNLIPNHNRLFRMKHPALCLDCDGKQCHACGVIWKLRQEMPVGRRK